MNELDAALAEEAATQALLEKARERAQLTHFGRGPNAPATAPGVWDTLKMSVGHGFGQLANGLVQLNAEGLAASLPPDVQQRVPTMTPEELAATFRRAEPYQPPPEYLAGRMANPVTAAIGESAPYAAASLGAGLLPGAARLVPGALYQAATGAAVGGAMPGSTDERLHRAGLDAAAGALGVVGAPGIARLFGGPGRYAALPPAERAIVDQAREEGFKVLPSTLSGQRARARNAFEGRLEANPGSANLMNDFTDHNQSAFNKLAAESIGEMEAPAPTAAVLNAARKRLGATYDTLMPDSRAIPLTQQDSQALVQLVDDSIRPFIVDTDPVARAVDRILVQFNTGATNARWVHTTQSRLRQMGQDMLRSPSGNSTIGHGLLDVADFLQSQIGQRGLSATERDLFQTTNTQYRLLSTLEHGSITDSVRGDVSPVRLASYLSRRDRYGFVEGNDQSSLYNATRFLGRLQPRLPSSGTAERMGGGNLPFGLGAGGAVGALGAGEPLTAAASGAVGVGAGLGLPWLRAKEYLAQRSPEFQRKVDLTAHGSRLTTPSVLHAVHQYQDPAPTNTVRDYAARIPTHALASLEDRPWLQSWLADELLPAAATPKGFALRLALLAARDKDLTPAHRKAILAIQQNLDPQGDYRLSRPTK